MTVNNISVGVAWPIEGVEEKVHHRVRLCERHLRWPARQECQESIAKPEEQKLANFHTAGSA